ncbi:MAG: hypothetical protein B6I28_00500 [Fusobacteriia bacterium 4572_132]|nr:MAG: hypothetical protein B6I28_00500 [Fusobacteriia bacterium 4572_132]
MEKLELVDEIEPGTSIIGLDLSLRSTGYAIIDVVTGNILSMDTIKTSKEMSDQETFMHISGKIIELCKKHNVKYAARETTFVKQRKTAIRLAELGGSVLTALLRTVGVKVLEGYAPANIKKVITGKGDKEKKDVAAELQKTYPGLFFDLPFSMKELKRKKIIKTDDLYDALGVAVILRRKLVKI